MSTLPLETTFIPHLRRQFESGAAVLFLGAGFSLGAKNTSGALLPSVADLNKELWKLCFPGEPYDSSTQLQDIYETALAQKNRELGDLLNRLFTVDVDSCTAWQKSILTMPWLRIYTLNIDDLVDKILSNTDNSRKVRSVSALTSNDPIFDDSRLSIVHLNGQLRDGPAKVTFSRLQYAERGGFDAAYTQLRTDLLFRPVVFIGSSLDEAPLWQHLAIRGTRQDRSHSELRPRSYIVIPALNKSKEALLSKFNVSWLQMKAEEFDTQIVSRMSAERVSGLSLLKQRANFSQNSPDRFEFVSDLASKSPKTEEYLLGAEPNWSDVTSGKVAKRECLEGLWNAISEVRASTAGSKFIVLTGTAGTGKTSALMVTALRLQAEGLRVAWLDSSTHFALRGFRQALKNEPIPDALLINDADAYDARASAMVRDALEMNARMVVICEARSGKVDRIVSRYELNNIEPIEFSIPSLCDSDIDAILDVLDREHRLGQLKGMSRDERQAVFRGLSGRQLLVAMHIATHGKEFAEKARDELKDLDGTPRFIYGVVCVASAHRYSLQQEDIGIACAAEDVSWLQSLELLKRRKLILPHRDFGVRARHRVIAQFVYDSLSEDGQLANIVRALIRIGASRITKNSPRESLHARLLRTFMNHELMKNWVGLTQAREIYNEFEDALDWSHHFWLHRGAMELETDNLDLAENFLLQAKSIDQNDIFVDNELAYLAFKKAILHPKEPSSATLVDDAIRTLNDIVRKRPDQIAHAYHIMGRQGLIWARTGISNPADKRSFLEYLQIKVKDAEFQESTEILRNLSAEIQRAILSLAI